VRATIAPIFRQDEEERETVLIASRPLAVLERDAL
jgi:hypothetical protein